MSVSKLPSGRWRAQVYHQGRNVNVSEILALPKGSTWPTKRAAKIAREKARERLATARPDQVTVKAWWMTWTTSPLYRRPKESTNVHNRERTSKFAALHADRSLASIGDQDVATWIAGGKNLGTVPALRAMFNDAASAEAGRLISINPFSGIDAGRNKRASRARQQPPTIEQAITIIDHARQVAAPSFSGWLQCAMFTGLRPGELDALTWMDVDAKAEYLTVRQQWNAKLRKFTPPKNGLSRPVPLHRESLEAIRSQPRVSEFVFVNLENHHWTASSRAYHWKATAAAAGWDKTLYLATRHFAGWYMVNILLLDSEDVAFALGHEDHGDLVRKLYGHRDRTDALERVKRAYASRDGGNVTPLRSVS